jgi:hypothetical protein
MAEKKVNCESVLGATKQLQTAVFDPPVPNAEDSRRLQAALCSICRPDYPAGMIPWLAEHHADLYTELTEKLPEEMNRLWTARRSIDEFDHLLHLWSVAHKTACDLYLASGDAEHAMPRPNK